MNSGSHDGRHGWSGIIFKSFFIKVQTLNLDSTFVIPRRFRVGIYKSSIFQICESENCGKPAKLRCPTCVKLALKDAYFCEQVGIFFF